MRAMRTLKIIALLLATPLVCSFPQEGVPKLKAARVNGALVQIPAPQHLFFQPNPAASHVTLAPAQIAQDPSQRNPSGVTYVTRSQVPAALRRLPPGAIPVGSVPVQYASYAQPQHHQSIQEIPYRKVPAHQADGPPIYYTLLPQSLPKTLSYRKGSLVASIPRTQLAAVPVPEHQTPSPATVTYAVPQGKLIHAPQPGPVSIPVRKGLGARVRQHQQQVQQGLRAYAPQQVLREEEEEEEIDPNPQYNFSFDVKDDEFTNYQNRQENRDGDTITGSYSVVDADGYVRTVTYTADPVNGFQAKVVREPTNIQVKFPVHPSASEIEEEKVGSVLRSRPAVKVTQAAQPLSHLAYAPQHQTAAPAYTLVPSGHKRLVLRPQAYTIIRQPGDRSAYKFAHPQQSPYAQ